MVKSINWPRAIKDIKMGLNRIIRCLEILGNPHLKIPPVIHIAGTNGKGSTVAFLENILKTAGYSSHIYTSPNLVHINERIKVSNQIITDEDLLNGLDEMKQIIQQKDPYMVDELTFFEGLTVFAFWVFSKIKADFTLLEVGLGGKLDATNVIPNPLITIITSISFDHMEFLGNTIEQITSQKAGIIKQNSINIVGFQPYPQAYKFFENMQDIYMFSRDFNTVENLQLGLEGRHQIFNAAHVIFAIRKLNEIGYRITQDNIETGLKTVFWPARMQDISKLNFIKRIFSQTSPRVILDGAHNENGIKNLVENIKLYGSDDNYVICSCLSRKDLDIFNPLAEISSKIKHFYTVAIHSYETSKNPAEIARKISDFNIPTSYYEYFYQALEDIKPTENTCIFIFGSLYLAGEVLSYEEDYLKKYD